MVFEGGLMESIYEGDCLEVMPTLATASIDAVVCDPPYGMAYRSNMRIARERLAQKGLF